MSFTNLKYDTETYRHDLRESTGTLKYNINTPKQCDECYLDDPNLRLQRAGNSVDVTKPMVDIDSELLGLNRKASKNPDDFYLPGKDTFRNNTKVNFDDCKMPKVESTRLSNPAENLRGTGWNRWEWLCHDPQAKLELPFSWNTNTNLLAKDNHRPYVPNPDDNNDVLPPNKGDIFVDPVTEFDEVPTEPVSVQWQSLSNIKRY
jgi:hypothetical protein